jgi:hypothetical protein
MRMNSSPSGIVPLPGGRCKSPSPYTVCSETAGTFYMQLGQVGTQAPKDHAVPLSLRAVREYKLADAPLGERSVNGG